MNTAPLNTTPANGMGGPLELLTVASFNSVEINAPYDPFGGLGYFATKLTTVVNFTSVDPRQVAILGGAS